MPTYQLEINGRRFEVEAPNREEAIRVANEFAVQPGPPADPLAGAPMLGEMPAPGFDPVPMSQAAQPPPESRPVPPYASAWSGAVQGGADFGREMGVGTMEAIAAMMPAGDTPQNVEPPFRPLPATTAGQFGRTVGNFLPGSLMGPGAFAAGNAARYGVIPGLVTEAAGQIGDEFGPATGAYARVAGAILGTGGAAAMGHAGISAGLPRNQAGGAQIIGRALRDARVTADEIDLAESLMNTAQERGIPTTWPEVLSAVTNGRVDLTSMQRMIEQARTGAPIMNDFMSARPPAIRRAVDAETATLGEAVSPAVLGPQIRATATEQINGLREQINASTRGLYETAAPVPVADDAFQALMQDPLFAEGLRAVRASPVYGRLIDNYPDNSVAVLDAVKKWLDDIPSGQRGQPTAEMIRGGVANQARDAAVTASPAYGEALSTQAFARENWLAPLENGPLGAMAGTDDLAAQLRAVFPTNPLTGTAQEVRLAIGLISEASPEAAQAIVRHHIEQVFNETAQATARGQNQAVGGQFFRDLQGNQQQMRNLEAAFVAAFDDGAERWAGFQNLMRVLEATGRRAGENSATAMNIAGQAAMASAGTPASRAVAALLSPRRWMNLAGDYVQSRAITKSGRSMADIITDPSNGDVWRRLAAGGTLRDLTAIAAELVIGQAPQISGNLDYRRSIADTLATAPMLP